MTSIRPNGRVEFRFYRPGMTDVCLVGSFNNWDQSACPMRAAGNGWWTVETAIESGEHHFRYIADGHWFTDFAANGVERNKHGWNSILIVPERRLRMPAPVKFVDPGEHDEAIAA